MSIFNRKDSTKNRLKSLEQYLGVYFEKEYESHEDNKYSVVEKIKERLDKLEGKKK